MHRKSLSVIDSEENSTDALSSSRDTKEDEQQQQYQKTTGENQEAPSVSYKAPPLPQDFEPLDYTYVIEKNGRSGMEKYPGNYRLKLRAMQTLSRYIEINTNSATQALSTYINLGRNQKARIIEDILVGTKEKCPLEGGAFVEFDEEQNQWVGVSDVVARQTIAGLVRDVIREGYSSKTSPGVQQKPNKRVRMEDYNDHHHLFQITPDDERPAKASPTNNHDWVGFAHHGSDTQEKQPGTMTGSLSSELEKSTRHEYHPFGSLVGKDESNHRWLDGCVARESIECAVRDLASQGYFLTLVGMTTTTMTLKRPRREEEEEEEETTPTYDDRTHSVSSSPSSSPNYTGTYEFSQAPPNRQHRSPSQQNQEDCDAPSACTIGVVDSGVHHDDDQHQMESRQNQPQRKRRKNVRPSIGNRVHTLPPGFQPSYSSVVIGKGTQACRYPGNKQLKRRARCLLSEYTDSKDRAGKTGIINDLLDLTKMECPVGAFIKYDKLSNQWVGVSDRVAREKIGYIIRDLDPDNYRSTSLSKVAMRKEEQAKAEQEKILKHGAAVRKEEGKQVEGKLISDADVTYRTAMQEEEEKQVGEDRIIQTGKLASRSDVTHGPFQTFPMSQDRLSMHRRLSLLEGSYGSTFPSTLTPRMMMMTTSNTFVQSHASESTKMHDPYQENGSMVPSKKEQEKQQDRWFKKMLKSDSEEYSMRDPVLKASLLPPDFRPLEGSVVIGKGQKNSQYPGNQRLRLRAHRLLSTYTDTQRKGRKSMIISSLFMATKKDCPVGAFIKEDKRTKRWVEVPDNVAREKIGYIFRDLDPDTYRPTSQRKTILRQQERQERQKEIEQEEHRQEYGNNDIQQEEQEECDTQRKEEQDRIHQVTMDERQFTACVRHDADSKVRRQWDGVSDHVHQTPMGNLARDLTSSGNRSLVHANFALQNKSGYQGDDANNVTRGFPFPSLYMNPFHSYLTFEESNRRLETSSRSRQHHHHHHHNLSRLSRSG